MSSDDADGSWQFRYVVEALSREFSTRIIAEHAHTVKRLRCSIGSETWVESDKGLHAKLHEDTRAPHGNAAHNSRGEKLNGSYSSAGRCFSPEGEEWDGWDCLTVSDHTSRDVSAKIQEARSTSSFAVVPTAPVRTSTAIACLDGPAPLMPAPLIESPPVPVQSQSTLPDHDCDTLRTESADELCEVSQGGSANAPPVAFGLITSDGSNGTPVAPLSIMPDKSSIKAVRRADSNISGGSERTAPGRCTPSKASTVTVAMEPSMSENKSSAPSKEAWSFSSSSRASGFSAETRNLSVLTLTLPQNKESVRQQSEVKQVADSNSLQVKSSIKASGTHRSRQSTLSEGLFTLREVWCISQQQKQAIARRTLRSQSQLKPKKEEDVQYQPRTLADRLTLTEVREKDSRFVIRPNGRLRLNWDLTAILLLAYDLVMVPLQTFDLPRYWLLTVMDLTVLLYWSGDVILSFVTAVYVNGQLEMRLRHIAWNYVRKWFLFDMVIVVPEWVLLFLGIADAGSTFGNTLKIARASRSTRFLRILRFLRLLRLVKLEKAFTDLRSRVNSNLALLSLSMTRLLLGIVVVIHILACAWYWFGTNSSKGWVYVEGIENKSVGDRYIFAFMFSMARLHPSAFKDNLKFQTNLEKVFSIFVSLFAIAGGGAFISTITNTMAQLQTLRQQRTRKLWIFREYSQEHHISGTLSIRVKMYIEKSINKKLHEAQATELASMLPKYLLMDLRLEAWSPYLSEHKFFAMLCRKHPRCIWSLCAEALQEVWVLVGDTIFTTGDACSRMLFLVRGGLVYVPGRIMGSGGDTVETDSLTGGSTEEILELQIGPGGSCSEPALWVQWENHGELCAFGDDTLLSLLTEEFIEEVLLYGLALMDSAERGRHVVHYLNRLDEREISDILPDHIADEIEDEKVDQEGDASKRDWAAKLDGLDRLSHGRNSIPTSKSIMDRLSWRTCCNHHDPWEQTVEPNTKRTSLSLMQHRSSSEKKRRPSAEVYETEAFQLTKRRVNAQKRMSATEGLKRESVSQASGGA